MSYSFFKVPSSLESLRFSFPFSSSRSWQQWHAYEGDCFFYLHLFTPTSLIPLPKPPFLLEDLTSKWGFRMTGGKGNVLLEVVFHFKGFFSYSLSSLRKKKIPKVKGCYYTFESINFYWNGFNLTDIYFRT